MTVSTIPPAWSIREGDTISLVTDAVCPVCHSCLLSISRVTRSIPTFTCAGHGGVISVRSKELVCTDEGCDYRHVPAQPELPVRPEDEI